MATARIAGQPQMRPITVVGVFTQRSTADATINALVRAGFSSNAINLVMRGPSEALGISTYRGSEAEEGAVSGGLTGAVIGGMLAITIPGIGPVLAAGPIATALGGVLGGAGAGSFIGALVGARVPEREAEWFGERIQAGDIILTVRADARREDAVYVLQQFGAHDIRTVIAPPMPGAASPQPPGKAPTPAATTPAFPAGPPQAAVPDIGPHPEPGGPAIPATSPLPQPRRPRTAEAPARARSPHITTEETRAMQTSETMRELRQQPAETIMDRLERLPSSTYFTAMIGSVLASLGLFLAGYRWASVFIGLWAPTILMFGAFAKLLRPSREMAGR